ncbi:hypothetical protein L218DRAFT_944225 [Marasmius fiardii PR-910]|nr:hypothetical protein L218DRAFT_944225 [Marasmius fiardii PR-910]
MQLAFLLGIPDEELVKLQARLPNLADVRLEAELAVELLKKPPPTDTLGIDDNGEHLGIIPPSLAYQFMFPNLSSFAYFCREEDVPGDLQDLCIWRSFNKDGGSEGSSVYGTLLLNYWESQTLCKITNHLLSARMNAPEDALPYAEAGMKLEERLKPGMTLPFLRNPQAYASYGTVLARTKSRDTEAKTVLQRVVDDIERVSTRNDTKMTFIQAKLYLARVLRRSGELKEAKKCESYLINWFEAKKCESYLINWFKKNANGVGDRAPMVPDRGSKECQIKDYAFHKVSCLEHAESLKRAQLIKSISPEDGRCAEDWNKYRSYYYDNHAVVHALGLKFHPSRGQVHILVRSLKYVPNGGKDVVDRFVVVAAGVFVINDILAEMDSLLNYNSGEAKQAVDELIEDFEQGSGQDGMKVAFFNLSISDDTRFGTHLGRGSVSKKNLLETNYHSNWRSLLNPGKKNITVQQVVL